MKVFLSWSGESSNTLAAILRDWFAVVFPEVTFWLSHRDIQAGQRWGNELDRELETTTFGILCLVPSNLHAPWLLFEAGALSKSIVASRVVPYCFGLHPEQLQGPLSRFQGVSADEAGTRRLVQSINALVENKRADAVLDRVFDRWWPDLKRELAQIPSPMTHNPNVVRVERILCAATAQYEQLGADDDMDLLTENYPNAVERLRSASLAALRDTLALNRFQIVHLLGYVEPRNGEFHFGDGHRLQAGGLLKLLEAAGASLVFLATCDSLTLGAMLSRSVNVVAASDSVSMDTIVAWERCFYGLLAKGTSLTAAYDLAQATADVPMRLLLRHDAWLVPAAF